MQSLIRLALAAAVLSATPVFAGDAEMSNANMEILTQKITADKKLLVASNMKLTEQEAKAFWPLYDQYQQDLQKINQQLAETLKEYNVAFNKGPIPDDTAKELLNKTFSIELAELKLKHTYADRMAGAIPNAKVARYIQIENKIRAVIKIQLAADIPLAY